MFQQAKRKSKDSKEKHKEKSKKTSKRISERIPEPPPASVAIVNETVVEPKNNTTEITSDDNSNTKINNPLSRDISIENQISLDTQIERGIMNLLEQEIARTDKKQYPPRPQSLSFYEDELAADDELSGQLQAQSPTEKPLQTRRNFQTINANNESDLTSQLDGISHIDGTFDYGEKNGFRKLKYLNDSVNGSREQIISVHKKTKKHKKGKGEQSGNGDSKKNRLGKNSFFNEGYQPRTEITSALEDLQDDVFDDPTPLHGYNYGDSPKSSHYYGGISPPVNIPTKIYVQTKDKFKPGMYTGDKPNGGSDGNDGVVKSVCLPPTSVLSLDVAVFIQKLWIPFGTFCQGSLAGLAAMYVILIITMDVVEDPIYAKQYVYIAECFKSTFFVLLVVSIVSVLDRYDVAHLDVAHLLELVQFRKSFIVIILYMFTMSLFLSTSDKAGFYEVVDNSTLKMISASSYETTKVIWILTCFGAILAWLIISCSPMDDLLCVHLENMFKFYERKIVIGE